jgi:hypothetical protein
MDTNPRYSLDGSTTDPEIENEGEEALEQQVPVRANLALLMTVEDQYGQPLGPEQWTKDAIEAICTNNITTAMPARIEPVEITITSPIEAILQFATGSVLVLSAIDLGRVTYWFGVAVKVDCMIATVEILQTVVKDRIEKRKEVREQESQSREDHLEQRRVIQELMTNFSAQVEKLEILKRELDSRKKMDSPSKVPMGASFQGTPSVEIPVGGNNSNNGGREVEMPGISVSSIGTSEVGTSKQRSPEIKGKIPKFDTFSGELPTPKLESTFDEWMYEISSSEGLYSERLMEDGIKKSLKGLALRQARFLGAKATMDEIMAKLTEQFGQRASDDVMLTEYQAISMTKGERIQSYTDRLQDTLSRIRFKYPNLMTDKEASESLRKRFFHGLTDKLRDSLRHTYRRTAETYNELVIDALDIEAEKSDGNTKKEVKVTSKATQLSREASPEREEQASELETLKMQMAKLMSATAAAPQKAKNGNGKKNGKPRGEQDNKSQNNAKKDIERKDPKDKSWQKDVQCYKCGGYGHYARECSSRLTGGGEDRRSQKTPQPEVAQAQALQEPPAQPETTQ